MGSDPDSTFNELVPGASLLRKAGPRKPVRVMHWPLTGLSRQVIR